MKKKQKQNQKQKAKVLILQEELINMRMEIIQVLKSHQESFEILSKDLETFKTLH